MTDPKPEARKAALVRRELAHAGASDDDAAVLEQVLSGFAGRAMAGYLPIRSEIDPRPAMAAASITSPVGVPVIMGRGLPLTFRRWTPETHLVDGPFGVRIPSHDTPVVPEVLIVPLVAFDRDGGRLGYGGGYYDRTLAMLRRSGPVVAIGFGFAAQQMDRVPLDRFDERLDYIVTETELIRISQDKMV